MSFDSHDWSQDDGWKSYLEERTRNLKHEYYKEKIDSNHQLPSQPTPRPRNQNMNNESQSSEGRRFSPLWIVSLHGFWTMVTIAVVTFAVAMMVTVPLGLLGVMDPSWPVYFYLKVLQSAALTHMLSAYASFTERLRFNFQVIMAFMNQTGIRYAFVALTYCSYGHLIGWFPVVLAVYASFNLCSQLLLWSRQTNCPTFVRSLQPRLETLEGGSGKTTLLNSMAKLEFFEVFWIIWLLLSTGGTGFMLLIIYLQFMIARFSESFPFREQCLAADEFIVQSTFIPSVVLSYYVSGKQYLNNLMVQQQAYAQQAYTQHQQ